MIDFVSYFNEQAEAGGEDGKVPEAEAKKEAVSPLVRLDKDNLNEKIKTGLAFIKFYAPWYLLIGFDIFIH